MDPTSSRSTRPGPSTRMPLSALPSVVSSHQPAPQRHGNLMRISHEIRTKFTLSSHSQANREDAGLDPCEWKKNGDNEAIVHQGSVILVCGTLGNIFLEILGTQVPCKRGAKGDFMAKHGHIHTRFNAQKERYHPSTKGTHTINTHYPKANKIN